MTERFRTIVTVLVLVLLSTVTLTGFGCRRAGPQQGDQVSRELVVWGLWQESQPMQPILDAFREQTGATVRYRKIGSVATYERDLLEAMAEGRGPDVFVIHHTWVDGKRRLMYPAPPDVIDVRAVTEEFVDAVAEDVVREGNIYALPVSVDTMAMYYNRDVLNAAGIARPPRTWVEFQQMVERITQVNRLGTIQRSGAALGTAANVNRAPDILQLLMMQSGLSIVSEQRGIDITNEVSDRSVTFYTDFSNRGKRVYTWNLQQDYSIDAFAEGNTATMFNYSYHVPTVRAKNPRLNFAIAPMPQIAGSAESQRVNFAAYWPFAVSNSSASPQLAWQFLRFMTSKQPADMINEAHTTPPARRDSVLELQRDPELGVFAEQALSAKSWPRVDIAATDTIFNTLIDDVVTGRVTISEGLRRAEDQLKQLNQEERDGF